MRVQGVQQQLSHYSGQKEKFSFVDWRLGV
jgi:hypothetical protein